MYLESHPRILRVFYLKIWAATGKVDDRKKKPK